MTKLTHDDSKKKEDWRGLRALVIISLFTFYATLLFIQPSLPAADDMARHVTNGELILQGNFDVLYENVYSYTDPGESFVNHHWFSGVIFYVLLSLVGWEGLTILKVAVYLAAFGLVFATAVRKADFWVVTAFSIPAILILVERMSLRPEMFSYLFIALTIYLLIDFERNPERKRIFWLIPLQLLWVNTHIFFSIGLMIAGAFLFEKLVKYRREFWKNPVVRKLALVLVCMTAVTFINPHGATGVFYRYPSEFPVTIAENQSLFEYKQIGAPREDIAAVVYIPLVGVLGVSLLYGLWRKRMTLFYLLGGIATAALGFMIMRGIYFFGFFFLLTVPMVWSPVFVRVRNFLYTRLPEYRRTLGVVCALVLCAILLYANTPAVTKQISPSAQKGIGLAPRSLDAGNFLVENDIKGPIFNDADIGSYLIYTLFPKERVFVDNLFADAYSPEVFREYLDMLGSEDAWRSGIARYNFNAIVFYQYDAGENVRRFIYTRLNDPEWAFIYGDPFVLIFVKNTEANREVIGKFHITPENISERLAHLKNADDFEGMVAYADIANLMGRSDVGIETFNRILQKWPENPKMWMITAEWELQRSGTPESARIALAYLEKALALGQTTAEVYSFMGLAHARLNNIEASREALNESLRINPNREDAKRLLAEIAEYEAQEVIP